MIAGLKRIGISVQQLNNNLTNRNLYYMLCLLHLNKITIELYTNVSCLITYKTFLFYVGNHDGMIAFSFEKALRENVCILVELFICYIAIRRKYLRN